MILKSIKIRNVKCFESFDWTFDKTTFIEGVNGTGKSTILESIIFCLYGFYRGLLGDMPTKGKSKSCSVELVIEDKGHSYRLLRHYPLKVEIWVDAVNKELNTADSNEFICQTFGDRLFFTRFRFLDILTKEADFLSEGQVALKKIIFAGMDDTFNRVRSNLMVLKSNRENYHQSRLVGFKCYPSEKRRAILRKGLQTRTTEYNKANTELQQSTQQVVQNQIALEKCKTKLNQITRELKDLNKTETCFTCHQSIPKPQQEELIKTRLTIRNQLEHDIVNFTQNVELEGDIRSMCQKAADKARAHKEKVRFLLSRLENRLTQSQYIYTDKDVLLVKTAIAELDKLSSVYIYETVKTLEPIINSVVEKIGFILSFDVDAKGKFNIVLTREGIGYKYKELSTGQKLMIQTAFKIAMLLNANTSGLLICDEGFSALDTENLGHIITLFNSLPLQLIFIAQRAELKETVSVLSLKRR